MWDHRLIKLALMTTLWGEKAVETVKIVILLGFYGNINLRMHPICTPSRPTPQGSIKLSG